MTDFITEAKEAGKTTTIPAALGFFECESSDDGQHKMRIYGNGTPMFECELCNLSLSTAEVLHFLNLTPRLLKQAIEIGDKLRGWTSTYAQTHYSQLAAGQADDWSEFKRGINQ